MTRLAAALLVIFMQSAAVEANVNIVFNYDYDTSHFYTESRKLVLDAVAHEFELRVTDDLLAVTPADNDIFRLMFLNPSGGFNTWSYVDTGLAADEYRIYVGASAMASNYLGYGGTGNFATNMDEADVTRGQAGYTPLSATVDTDFGGWGGYLAMNSQINWDFGLTTTDGIAGYDFYSVVMHEVGHVLGFGINEAWTSQTYCASGSCSIAGMPLAGTSHWATGSKGYNEAGVLVEAAMDPDLSAGVRKGYTSLDWQGLTLAGWDVVQPGSVPPPVTEPPPPDITEPAYVVEPSMPWLIFAGLVPLALVRRNKVAVA